MPARVCCPSAMQMAADRMGQTERRLVGEKGAVRRSADQLHQVERIGAAHAAAADAEEAVHRPHVVALADQPLHEFEAVDVGQREVRLDAVLDQAFDVFEIEVGSRVGHKVGHRMKHRRIGEARPFKAPPRVQRRQIIESGAAGDCDLIWLGIDFGQLVRES